MTINEVDYSWNGNFTVRTVTDTIIIHHAAADGVDALTIHNWHLGNGWTGIAYHYYVRRDGEIYRGRPEDVVGGHTSNENFHTIGICFEGNFENQTMPDVQFNSGVWLLADILTRYPDLEIKGHYDFNATACPGSNFPLVDMVESATAEPDVEIYDDDPSDYALEACTKAVEIGLFKGDTNGDFHWKDSVSRQDFCVLMDRLGVL